MSKQGRLAALKRDSLSSGCCCFRVNDRERFGKACRHFDCGEYFEAHEEWEELWHLACGSHRSYLQGLIQVAVSLHHARNGNSRGSHKLLARALEHLEQAGSGPFEIDLERVKRHILDFELALRTMESGRSCELPYFSLPFSHG